MKVEIEVKEIEENRMFFHEEVATFDGGRVLSVIGSRSLVIETDKHDCKYKISVSDIIDALDEKVGL